MYNKNNPDVISNLPDNQHIYVMKNGTFEFEDEHNCLSRCNYKTFEEVKSAFYKYSADLCSGTRVGTPEYNRRLFLADVLRGLRNTINHVIYSPENATFHKRNNDAIDSSTKIFEGLDAYVCLLDQINMPF